VNEEQAQNEATSTNFVLVWSAAKFLLKKVRWVMGLEI